MPVKVGYPVLEAYLREKLTGEIIQKEKSNGHSRNFAQILEVSLYHSPLESFDLALDLQVQTLTTLWKNKRIDLALHMCLDFDKELQKISISSYKMMANSKSKIADTLLEGIFNTWFYKKFRNKMDFDFSPKISSELKKINQKLRNQMETAEGVYLSGELETVRIEKIEALHQHFLVHLQITGDTSVEIKKIKF